MCGPCYCTKPTLAKLAVYWSTLRLLDCCFTFAFVFCKQGRMEAEKHAGSWPTDPFSPQHLSAEISHFCLAAPVLSSPGMSWAWSRLMKLPQKLGGLKRYLENYQETRRQEKSPQPQEAPNFYFALIATNYIPAPPTSHPQALLFSCPRNKNQRISSHIRHGYKLTFQRPKEEGSKSRGIPGCSTEEVAVSLRRWGFPGQQGATEAPEFCIATPTPS